MLTESVAMRAYEIPISEIFCDNDFNCRGAIAPIDVLDLAQSIDKHGLQQPIIVQPWTEKQGKKYRIVSGHRRYQAHRVLDKQVIPAIIRDDLNELTARKLNLEENLKRKNLNILQEAHALEPFIKAGWIQQMIANELSQSQGWVQTRVALLRLPEEIQQEAAAGFLTQEHIKQLSGMKSKTEQFEAVKKIKQHKISGEKGKINVKPAKKNVLKKKRREVNEIFEMQTLIQDAIGNNFGTRCLAWAGGEISSFELMKDIKEIATREGKRWEIPKEALLQVSMY